MSALLPFLSLAFTSIRPLTAALMNSAGDNETEATAGQFWAFTCFSVLLHATTASTPTARKGRIRLNGFGGLFACFPKTGCDAKFCRKCNDFIFHLSTGVYIWKQLKNN
jgi:hypothetical protein